MKNVLTKIGLLLSICFCINIMMDGVFMSKVQAAPLTQAEKARKAREKEKAKKAREKEKAKKARERAKAKAKKQKAKKSSSSKASSETDMPRITSRETFEQALAEIEAYNERVDRYMARDITHRVGAWGQLGYSAILPGGFTCQDNPAVGFNQRAKGGVGGGLGVGYQMRYKRFLLQTGLEFQAYNSTNSLYSSDKKDPMLVRTLPVAVSSPHGDVFATAIYTFTNPTDQLVAGYVQLPVLFGMEFSTVPLYFLAGPKIGINVLRSSKLASDATIQINDPELVEDLHDLSLHNLSSDRISSATIHPKFGMNLALSAELGMKLDAYMPEGLRTRVGAFIEYGVLNIQSASNIGSSELPFILPQVGEPIGLQNIQMCSSIQTSSASSARLNPLMVGVKVSVMYDLPRREMTKKALPTLPDQQVVVSKVELNAPTITIEKIPQVVSFGDIELRVGSKVKIDNLFFATNKTDVLPQSGPALEALANFMKQNPQVSILLIGHTDSIGTERANQILSEGRVKSVRDELIKRGVEISRMTVEGRGESQPIDTNSTEEGRQNNRRVEFVITSMGEE